MKLDPIKKKELANHTLKQVHHMTVAEKVSKAFKLT
jgi:hypothetical protein